MNSVLGPNRSNHLMLGRARVSPPLMLAPMMDLTGRAFREAVRVYGGCGLFYSEMLNARRIAHEKPNSPILAGFTDEKDLALQLLGDDPTVLAHAASKLEDWFQPVGVDFNLGCSRQKIMKYGWGAALAADRSRAAAAIRALRRVVKGFLTVKIRTVWEQPGAEADFIRMLGDEGVDGLIVHPREPTRIFSRPARWDKIARIKALASMPVVGNGDVRTPADGAAMLSQTGCDGVMIGRAAAARLTLFRETADLLAGKVTCTQPSLHEQFEQVASRLEPELHLRKRAVELKTFCQFFSEALPVPHWFWGPLQSLQRGEALVTTARRFFLKHRDNFY